MNDENVWFRAWVANTVHAISGIWPLDWRGLQRKRALTCEEVRAMACQDGFADSFETEFLASARPSQLATANKRILH